MCTLIVLHDETQHKDSLFPRRLNDLLHRLVLDVDCARTTLAMWAVSSRRSKDGWLELVESSIQLFGTLLADAGDIQVDICVSLEAVDIAQQIFQNAIQSQSQTRQIVFAEGAVRMALAATFDINTRGEWHLVMSSSWGGRPNDLQKLIRQHSLSS
ncbi:hypothetical protein DPV78_005947 [Talaromyces pinophilus]|nr:hypothetical protein DPV78_005947 [Talaromyces pinophilus]